MSMQAAGSSGQNALPGAITDFIIAFMRAINTACLYASDHVLFKKHTQQLYSRLGEAMAHRAFLFLGCARDAIFLEGSFYQVKDPNLQKFLKFFHSLRICHILLEKGITTEGLESFIGLLAGAQRGQGDEVSSALIREKIKHVRLGLLDYAIFSTAQAVASRITEAGEDEAIWRQLILQPAGAGDFSLSREQADHLTKLSGDVDELRKLLLQMGADMVDRHEGVSVAHRGMLLWNFIQNLGDVLARVDPTKRNLFARHVVRLLYSLEPPLRIRILGAVAPGALRENNDVVHEVLRAMSDSQFVHLLRDAMKEEGTRSACFANLFNRALGRYKGAGLLLRSIRQQMHRATREGDPGALSHWQQLEELLLRQEETEEFNEQFRREIDALATSIKMKVPVVEEEEMARLRKTLEPESLRPAKAQLIIDLTCQLHATRAEAFVASLLESLGEILRHFLGRGNYLTAGNLLRDALLALSDYPEDGPLRETMASLLNAEDIRALLGDLLERCHTYETRETAAMDAICRLYPEKAGDFLLDVLLELGDEDSPQARWLWTALAGLGPRLSKILNRRLLSAADHAIPRLLSLVTMAKDARLGSAVGMLLEHRNHEIRVKAVTALGALRAEALVPRLSEIVLQKRWVRTKKTRSLQVAAARALAEIGTDKARGVLEQVITKGSGELRAVCQELV